MHLEVEGVHISDDYTPTQKWNKFTKTDSPRAIIFPLQPIMVKAK